MIPSLKRHFFRSTEQNGWFIWSSPSWITAKNGFGIISLSSPDVQHLWARQTRSTLIPNRVVCAQTSALTRMGPLIVSSLRAQRRCLFVLDDSGSMRGEKINAAVDNMMNIFQSHALVEDVRIILYIILHDYLFSFSFILLFSIIRLLGWYGSVAVLNTSFPLLELQVYIIRMLFLNIFQTLVMADGAVHKCIRR